MKNKDRKKPAALGEHKPDRTPETPAATTFPETPDAGKSRLRLVKVRHRFDDDVVRFASGEHLLFEHVIGFFKRKVAERGKHLADWSDIESDLCSGEGAAGLLRILHGCADQLLYGIPGGCHLVAVGAESICIDDLGTGRKICLVNALYPLGFRNVPNLGNAAEREPESLQHRSHAAVQDTDCSSAHASSFSVL